MRSATHEMILANPSLCYAIIRYFLAEVADPNQFNNQIQAAIRSAQSRNDLNSSAPIRNGYFSIGEFSRFAIESMGFQNGIPSRQIELFVSAMEKENIVTAWPNHLSQNAESRFRASGDRARFLFQRGLVLNAIGGWGFIVESLKRSVVKIENEAHSGDKSLGTGFYYAAGNELVSKYAIVTNKHVIENAKTIKVLLESNEEVTYSELIVDPVRDLGYIILSEPLNVPIIHLNSEKSVLEDVVTLGYPSIPMARDAYQVYHRGEINGYINDYVGNELLIFSAKTSSGNSGSPIVDRFGMAVGIVAQELFSEDEFRNKGKLPYYAGIPTSEIIDSMNAHLFLDTQDNEQNEQ